MGGCLAIVVAGIGGLKWARTGQGQAVLLTMGSEKMFGEVQVAVDEALLQILPGYLAGPMGATDAMGQGGSEATTGFDWPVEEMGPGAVIRCREVVLADDITFWEAQHRIGTAVEAVGARILWGERLYADGRRGSAIRPDEQKDMLRVDLGVAGKPTHTLVLHRAGNRSLPQWDRWPGRTDWNALVGRGDVPTVALVIDDWGYARNDATTRILDLPVPLTLAVLPGLRYSRHFALQGTDLILPPTPNPNAVSRGSETQARAGQDLRLAAGCPVEVTLTGGRTKATTKRREILLHLPMEPQSYPDTNPGDGAIMVGMESEEIERRLDEALSGLPMATGVNNHMGSAATADRVTMDRLMHLLAGRNLLFLDSLTSSRSVAYSRALAMGLPALKNRIFLDYDHEEPERIAANLAALVRAARGTGFAVGIGHPHPATAEVLARELPKWRAQGVRFVTVSEFAALQSGS